MDGLMTVLAADIPDEAVPIMAIGVGFVIAIVAIVGGLVRSVLRTSARERTKRELAAYVAEGSMRPEDAERIIKADRAAWERDERS